MGKSLIQQKRGKGSPRYKAPSFRYKGKAYVTNKNTSGEITDILHCPGHSAPLAQLKYENGEGGLILAPEGIKVGDIISIGDKVKIRTGNVLPLKNIPEGTTIYNIESSPGDGGKFVRTSGLAAKIITKFKDRVVVQLPSSKKRNFNPECRAIIGIIAGSGRPEKPFLKAGNKFYSMKAKNKLYPIVSGTSMNAVSHPFGGTSSATKGRPTQAKRSTPPGRKVGKIAPKSTGKKKR
jgi:large subunit ribosomal protein L2